MQSAEAILPSKDGTSEAYHGTNQEIAGSIESNGFIISTTDRETRYGNGIYFWLYSKESAVWWAKKRYPAKIISVFKSTVDFGRLLNLATPEGEKIVELTARKISQKTGKSRIKEAAVLNFLAQKGWIDTAMVVHMPDIDLGPLFNESYSRRGIRTILCVYNIDKILCSSIVYEELPS